MQGSFQFIGIDVSKEKIDIYGTDTEKIETVKNTREAVRAYVENLPDSEHVLAVIDLSGGYETICVREFYTAGFKVAAAEGVKVRSFTRTLGETAKTDSIDARVLAEYGKRLCDRLRLYEPRNGEMRKLLERIYDLKATLQEEKNRYQAPDVADFIREDVRSHIAYLEGRILELTEVLDQEILADDELKNKRDVPVTMKGIGKKSAVMLAVMLPEPGRANRRQTASLAGVAPIAHDSGTYRGHRFTRRGRPNVKKSLFICAMSAARHDERLSLFYNRLTSQGKQKKLALVAVMRKMIVIANAKCKEIFQLG